MSQRVAVLRRVLGNGRLRRVELAFLLFAAAEYGVWVAVLVYAYERGGTTTTALIAVLQLLPAALTAPIASRLADSRGARLVLWVGYVAQSMAIALCGAGMLSHAPAAAVYAAAVVACSAVTLTRPAQGALLPQLVDSPAELTAANVVSGWMESASLLIGPAFAGVMIALDGPGAALVAYAVAVSGSALLVGGLRVAGGDIPQDALAPGQSLRIVLRGGSVLALLAVGATQFMVIGALDVLEVVLALKLLGLGASGAGYLASAYGAGAVIGAGAALALVGRQRLVAPLLGSAIVWGCALIALGAWPAVVLAFTLLAAAGAAHTLLDVSGRTLLHRAVPAEFHGRVFGVLEGLSMLGLAAGSILVPLVAGIASAQAALICVGALLIAVPLGTTATLRSLELAMPEIESEVALLLRSKLFSMLSAPVLEDLARSLVRIEVPAEYTIITEGERGDRFYLLADGELEVTVGKSPVRRLTETGDGFGEIALLRDGTRTASVRSLTPSTLYALERAPFLAAVTGSYHSQRVADELVAQRLELA